MFDKMKQLAQLKRMQSEMSKEKFEYSQNGVLAVVNGNMAVENIVLNPELSIDKQASVVKDCVNQAMKKAQMEMAKKLSGMMK